MQNIFKFIFLFFAANSLLAADKLAGDIESAKKMAIAYKDAGATQLVHTQGYETVAHYREIIEKLENFIKPFI